MNRSFTTIADVTAYLVELEPTFTDALTADQLRDIVQANRENRYEDLTEAEINAMYNAAMTACNDGAL